MKNKGEKMKKINRDSGTCEIKPKFHVIRKHDAGKNKFKKRIMVGKTGKLFILKDATIAVNPNRIIQNFLCSDVL